MKKCLLLLLLTTNLFAQEMPISESNCFVYDKYNYGNDFLNTIGVFKEHNTGAVICSPYSKAYIKIGNTTSIIPFIDKSKNYHSIQAVFNIKGKQYYCTPKNIFVLENNKLTKNFILNKNKHGSGSFTSVDNSIYFLSINYSENPSIALYKLNGEKVILIKQFFAKNFLNSNIILSNKKVYFYFSTQKQTVFYSINGTSLMLEKKFSNKNNVGDIINFSDVNNFSFYDQKGKIISVKNDVFLDTKLSIKGFIFMGGFFSKTINNQKYIYQFKNDSMTAVAHSSLGDTFVSKLYSEATNSYYCGTNGDFIRLFPHIKIYPRLFLNSNSKSVFTLQQDNKGQIWAGSYQGALSIITNTNKIIQSKDKNIKFLNGGINYKNKMLLFGENNMGLLAYKNIDSFKAIADNFVGYYAYISKNKELYLGTSLQGIWHTDLKNLDSKGKIIWNKITDKQGLNFENVLTINEDSFGNIWAGGKGICVYNPKTNKLFPFAYKENLKFEFLRTRTSLLDSHKTLWFGTNNGEIIFYNGKNAIDYSIKNFFKIKHPLLENGKIITFIHQWKDYLILGGSDKVLLFDLKKWYATKTVSVRYLNSMEANLTSNTEQNTILTDKRDESIWFATSDMLYQWDIKKWLTLPTFKVIPSVLIKKDSIETEYTSNKNIEFEPTENSFDIAINYQTKDNMPRFLNGVLVKKNENPVFESPNLQTQFQFKNLSAGDYVFYVRICQQDGSFDVFEYPICIVSFVWQKWWFWLLLSIPILGMIIYFFQKRNEIEKQKKKLSQLNLSSLSNQFRPHFMLNALNSIGSQMQGKPHAEKVISRLGESINILYAFTQKNEFTLPFNNEWKLVENSIEIQRLLFIPNLNFDLKNKNIIPSDYKIPVGLIQIPVENALLHGLRNKTDGNCVLEIEFNETEMHYYITITDNGVGRDNATKINNFKKNGNGLKTIFEMITIINQHQKNAITFIITDKFEPSGTIVKITLNKNIDYDKIKI